MADDGRLELDDRGRVVDGSDADLADVPAADVPRGWLDVTAAPFLARHRTALRILGTLVAVGAVGGWWWAARPQPVPPTVDVALENAVLRGNDLGGPEISPDGVITVAFVARARTPGETVALVGLTGPGLRDAAVTARPISSTEVSRVEVSASVDCADASLPAADATAYAFAARATSSTGETGDGVVPLTRVGGSTPDDAVTRLDLALAGWCLQRSASSAVVLGSPRVTPVPGAAYADVVVPVRSTADLELTVAAHRYDGTSTEVDSSPPVTLVPGQSGELHTRVLARDCTVPPSVTPLSLLPNGFGPSATPGLALELSFGGSTMLASYAVPAELDRALTATVCAGATRLTGQVLDVAAERTPLGAWRARIQLDVHSDGMRVSAVSEHFDGPPGGMPRARPPATAPDLPGWTVGDGVLDGGAGPLSVTAEGSICDTVGRARPATLSAHVLMPDGRVLPYTVLLDDIRVLRAAYGACGLRLEDASGTARGWRSES